MGVIKSVILDEYDRNKRMQQAYEHELEALPRASITQKKINGHVYYYWMYRENGKVVNKYISAKNNRINDLLEQVQRRRELKRLIRNLRQEQSEMERYLRVTDTGVSG